MRRKTETAEAALLRIAQHRDGAEQQNSQVVTRLIDLLSKVKADGSLMGLHIGGASVADRTTDLYLRNPNAATIDNILNRSPSMFLLLTEHQGRSGIMHLVTGMESGAQGMVRLGINPSCVLDEEPLAPDEYIPFLQDAKSILRSLIPTPGSNEATALRQAHEAMRKFREQSHRKHKRLMATGADLLL